jgi:hypothetical protein
MVIKFGKWDMSLCPDCGRPFDLQRSIDHAWFYSTSIAADYLTPDKIRRLKEIFGSRVYICKETCGKSSNEDLYLKGAISKFL